MTPQEQQFTEDMGQLLAGWSLPRATGRVYGYLLLQGQPATLDQIAVDLAMAKSGVSVATRRLLAFGLARSGIQRGGRRLLFEALYDLDAIIAARNTQMLNLVERLHQGAQAARAARARERLSGMASDVETWMDLMREMVARPRERRPA